MANFWRTFHHDGKICPGWWWWGGGARPPPFTLFTLLYKVVVHASVEWQIHSKRMKGERGNRVSVSALSARAYTATLYVMVIIWKGVGVGPTLTSQGWFFHNDGMYVRNRQSPLCVYSEDALPVFHLYPICTLWVRTIPMSAHFQAPHLFRHHRAPRILRRQAVALLRERCSPGQRAPPSAVRSSWGMSSTCPVRSAFTS
jgi:hypothetical protein